MQMPRKVLSLLLLAAAIGFLPHRADAVSPEPAPLSPPVELTVG